MCVRGVYTKPMELFGWSHTRGRRVGHRTPVRVHVRCVSISVAGAGAYVLTFNFRVRPWCHCQLVEIWASGTHGPTLLEWARTMSGEGVEGGRWVFFSSDVRFFGVKEVGRAGMVVENFLEEGLFHL